VDNRERRRGRRRRWKGRRRKKETKKMERKGRRGKEEREKKEEAEGEDGGWVVLSDRDLTPRRLDTYTILSVSTPSTSLAFLDETTMMTYRSLHK
jgi:hypothetical protein